VAFDGLLIKGKHSLDDPPPKRAVVIKLIEPEGGERTIHEGQRMTQFLGNDVYSQDIQIVRICEDAKLPNHEAYWILDAHLNELDEYLQYLDGERVSLSYDEWKDGYKRLCEAPRKHGIRTLREARESVDAQIAFPYRPEMDQPEERLMQALKDIIVNDKPLQLGGETTTMELVKWVAQTSPYDSVREAARRRLIEYLGELKAKAYIEVYTGPTNPKIEAELEKGIQ
jgi:hypothetical protein